MLFNAGDHTPVMPLLEVVGNALKAPPAQIAFTALNVGAVPGVTVTITVF